MTSKTSLSQGILYVTAGEKYIRAAMRSAETVRKYSPELPIHLYADWRTYNFAFNQTPYPFTSVGEITNPQRRYGAKVDHLVHTPFEQTLYLDSDTAIAFDIREMFSLLDRFDIALAHAHRRNYSGTSRVWHEDIPKAFPQFNSGVILYRKTPTVAEFFESWANSFREAGFAEDQVTLRELLWKSRIRIATLPPEYNVRFPKYQFLWSKTETEAKIFHMQMYHDGPFWFLKVWGKQLARALRRSIGMDSSVTKNRING